MDKTFTKILFFLLFILLASTRSFSQTISTGTIDPGPYGQGSTIAVPISVNDATGCIALGNVYTLYLSDASGNFSPGTVIGSYSGIYTPFVNGLIPPGTPAGTGYKVKVTASSPSASVSVASSAFEIKAVPGVKPSASSDKLIGADPEVFGSCSPSYDPINTAHNTVYNITNHSATGTTTISFYNQLMQAPEGTNIAITNPGDMYTFKPSYANYTATVKTVNSDHIIGTYDYQIINNQSITNFGAAGSTSICLYGNTGDLSFHINIPAASAGIELNYPGDTYLVNWGDGSITTYTFCQLKASNGFVTHTFTLPSCSTTGNGVPNSFYVQSQTVSQYCGSKSAPSGVSAKVLIVPVTSFTDPGVVCAGTPVTLYNTSQPGPDPNSTVTNCNNNVNQLYDWYVDNVLVGPNYPLNKPFVLPATTTAGTHHVVLHTQIGTQYCDVTDFPLDICFEKPPQPVFTVPQRVCASATDPVTPTNTSIIDATCSASSHQYVWTVTGPAAVGYANSTNANSQFPQFLFNTAGTYSVQLGITTSGCGTITAPVQTVIVDALPVAQLSADYTICGTNKTLKFDATTTSKTYTVLTGSTTTTPTTYLWTVTGGASQFVGGTTANSQYPQIKFTEDKTYTVTVTNTNSCSPPATSSQQIIFVEQPAADAGAYLPICANSFVTLAATADPTNGGFLWSGGAGTFSDKTSPTSTYTPAASEAGTIVTLTLTVKSPSPCGNVTKTAKITVNPVVKVNSPLAVGICSGTKIGYTITADHSPATFTWTASVSSGNPTGFTAGSGSSINDLLVNSTTGSANPVDETVTYHITPTYNNNGCPGPIADVVVTVHPLPTITAAPATSPICTGKPANITFQSNIANTTYSWTTDPVTGISGNVNQTTFISGTNGIQDALVNSTLTTQTVTYHVTPRNGSCDGATIDVHVVVGPAIIADAGNDDEICGVTSYTLHGNTPVVGTGHWQTIQGPTDAFIETPDNPTTLVSNLTLGHTYKFEWTVTAPSGVCSNFSDVTIQVDAPTDPGNTSTGDPTIVCAGSATGTGTITLGPHTGAILGWEYSTDGSNYYPLPANTTKFQTFGPLTAGIWWYRAIVKNGLHCDVLKSGATQITAIAQPTIPDAGQEDRICNTGDYKLQGNTPTSGIGTWTASSTDVTFDNPNDPHTWAHGLVAGTIPYVFTWTIRTASPCDAPFSTVTIHDDLPAVRGTLASTTSVVCSNDATVQTITLANNVGNVVDWQYSTDGQNYNLVSQTPNTSTTQTFKNLTTDTWYRAIIKNGLQCDTVITLPVHVEVVQPPSASFAGNEDRICGDGSYHLQATAPTVGTGQWLPVAGVTFDDPNDPHTWARGLVAGTTPYTFTWQITSYDANGNHPCQSTINMVNIYADPLPVRGTLTSPVTTVCSNDATEQTISLGGNLGTVVDWQYSTDGQNYNSVSNTPNTATQQTFKNLTTDTWYRAIIKNGQKCDTVITQPIIITVVQPPSASVAGNDGRICGDGSYHLQATAPAVGIGQWLPVAGVTFDDPNDPHTWARGLVAGTTPYTFTWQITSYDANGNHPCQSTISTVTIHADPLPVRGTLTTPVTTVCSNDATIQTITLGGNLGNVVDWQYSTDGQNYSLVSQTPNPTTQQTFGGLAAGTWWYRAIVKNGQQCDTVITQPIIITVVDPPSDSHAGTDDRICAETVYHLQGNTPVIGIGKWTASSPDIHFVNENDPNTMATGLVAGNAYIFTWTISHPAANGYKPCGDKQSFITITDEVLPVATTTGAATVCSGTNAGQIKVTGQFTSVDSWQYSEDNGTTWQTIPGNTGLSVPYFNLTVPTLYRAMVVIGPKCGPTPSSVTTINVVPLPPNADAGTSRPVCGLTSYTLEGNDPGTGNSGKWTPVSGPAGALFLDDTDPHTKVGPLIPGNTYQFKWTITATGSNCTSIPSIVQIIDDVTPVGGTTSSDAVVCRGQNDGLLNLTGSSGVIDWQYSVDGGHTWTSTGNSGLSQSYHNLTQDTWYQAELSNGAVCTHQFSTITKIIMVDPPVTSNPGQSLSVCNKTSYTLQGNDPGTGTGLWTLATGSDPATIATPTDPQALVSGMSAGHTYKFTWTITGASPTSDHPCGVSANTVTITDDLPPLPGTISPDITVCKATNSGSVSLQGQFGSIVWMSSTDNGNTWNPTGYTTDTQPYAGLTQTTKYKAMLTHGACGPVPSDIVTVYVVDPPVDPNAGQSLSICNTTTYTLQGNDPSPGTGLWTVATGSSPANIANPTDPHAMATGLVAGNIYKFTWTITGASPTSDHPCGTKDNTVTITDDLPPLPGTISPDITVCKAVNSGSVSLSGSFGSIVWMSSTDNGNTWNPTGSVSTSQPYAGLTQTTKYKAMLTNGTCGPIPSDIVTVYVADPAVDPDAGQSLSICNQTTYILEGNSPGQGIGKWTTTQGTGVTILHDTDPNATATGLVAGNTYKFTWTITGYSPTTDHPCGTKDNTVTITDDLLPVAGTITPDETVCKVNNSGNVSLSNSSGSIVWKSSTDGHTWFTTGNTSQSQPYGGLTQTTYYQATVSNGSCPPALSAIATINVVAPPVTANAGQSLSICAADTYVLQGNDPGTGTGKWTVAQGAGVNILNDTSPNATATGLVAGNTYQFTWTITGYSPTTVHPCDPSPSTVTITDDLAPIGGTASADATVCTGDNHGSITLADSHGTIQWVSSTDGHTWIPTGFTNTIQPYTNLTQTTQYKAILTSGTSCPVAYSNTVTITVGQPPVPSNAGANQSVCNVTAYTLQGNDPGSGTGKWTLATGSDPATFDVASDPHTIARGLVAGGTYLFTWTTYGSNPDGTVSVCNPNATTVKITNDRLPIGGTTAGDNTVCSGINSGTITLTNQFGTIQWVSSTDNGTTWVSTGNSGTTQPYSNLTGTTKYMAILSNGTCGISNSTVTTITIGPAPIPSNPGADDEVCSVSTYKLKAVLPVGATGKWTIESGAGAQFDDPTDPATTVKGLIAGNTYKFTWTVLGTSPCAPIPGTVTIKDDLPANGGVATPVPAIICAGNNAVVTLAGQSGNILRWESSTDGTTWQPIYITGPVQTFSNLQQTIQFRAISIGQGVCGEVPSAPAVVTVNPTTVVSDPGKDDEICNVKTYPLNANSPLPNTGLWTITGGPTGATLDDPTDPKTTARGLIAGNTYQFTWTITGTAPCGPSSNAVNIKIDLQAIGGTTTGATTVCSGGNDGLIYLNGQFGTIVKWVSSNDNGANWADVPNTAGATSYHYNGLTQTTQYKALLHEDGKCGDVYSTTTIITVNPQTVIANAGQNFNICNTSITKLNGNNPAPFTGMWTQTAGPKVDIDAPASYQTVVRGLAKGNVYTFKWTITGLAPCGDTDASVTIGAYEDVIPSFTQTQSQSCGVANVTFTNTSTPSPVGTFEWDFGDGTPIYTGVNPPTHSFAPSPNGNEVTYTVRLTPVSNCGVQTPYVGTVKVSPAKPIASLLPAQISYCGTFSLSAKNMSPGNNAQYDFYMKDAKGSIVQHVRMSDTSTAVFQPITPTASTYYSVYVVATDFCGNQGTSSVINVAVAPSSLVSGIQIKGGLENVCLGSPITFQNISTGGDRFTVTIYDNAQKAILRMPSGTGDQNYTPTAIGTYYVSITAGNTGCGDAPASALTPFNVYPSPDPAFIYTVDNSYNVSFLNNTPDVTGIPAPSLNYVWDFGDGSQKETNYVPKAHHFDASRSPFTVTLTATTPGTECFNVATKTIDIKFHGDLYVPNAFIPASQNKQLNTYIVKGTGMKTWHMQIFNNFGQLIWESTKLDANGSPTEGWDGTYKGRIVEQGVYIWQISATLLNGEEWKGMSYNGSTPSKTGPIHLIR